MSAAVRLGDTSDHGGEMSTALGTILVDGRKLCVDQDILTCPIHGKKSVTGTGKVNGGNKKAIKVGDKAQCGATIIKGSSTVNIG